MPEITSRASIAGDVLPVRASATLEDFVADENPCPVTLASLGEAIDSHARDPLQRPRNCTAVWKDISLDPDAPATKPGGTGSSFFSPSLPSAPVGQVGDVTAAATARGSVGLSNLQEKFRCQLPDAEINHVVPPFARGTVWLPFAI